MQNYVLFNMSVFPYVPTPQIICYTSTVRNIVRVSLVSKVGSTNPLFQSHLFPSELCTLIRGLLAQNLNIIFITVLGTWY